MYACKPSPYVIGRNCRGTASKKNIRRNKKLAWECSAKNERVGNLYKAGRSRRPSTDK